tara:strand:+ start:126 stop:788 length:663 start_codon:yes stop_codon:yes gene_type:complete
MDELVNYIYSSLLNKEILKKNKVECYGNTNIYLEGIKSIDGLPCEVKLEVSYAHYLLDIRSKNLCKVDGHDVDFKTYYRKKLTDYTATQDYEKELEEKEKGAGQRNSMKIIKKDDLIRALTEMIRGINLIKFNIFKGEFLEYDLKDNIYMVLKSPNVVIEEGEDCAVCFCKTKSKTWCNHSVCYKCMEKINNVSRDGNGNLNRPCPLCRKNILVPVTEYD